MRTAAALALVLLALDAGAAYRWVDRDGRVHYTDTPPPADAKRVEKKALTTGGAAAPAAPGYALQQAAEKYPATLFATPDCGDPCAKARAHLSARGVPYAEQNPSLPDVHPRFAKVAGANNVVPLLLLGESQVAPGFEAGEWDRLLDAAGYPKPTPRAGGR